MNKILWATLFSLSMLCQLQAQVVSRTFEMRFFSDSTYAEGFTGFNGDSTIFSAADRFSMLENYAEYAKGFYEDYDLEFQPFTEADIDKAEQSLLPYPMPTSENRIGLQNWQYETTRNTSVAEQEAILQDWTKSGEATIKEGKLYANQDYKFAKDFSETQSWRFSLEWDLDLPQTSERTAFSLLDRYSNPVVLIGVTAEGNCFYKSALGLPIGVGDFTTDTLVNFKLFVDIEAARFSLYLNDQLAIDFVRALSTESVERMFIQLPTEATLDNMSGISYQKPAIDPSIGKFPNPVGTLFFEETFEVKTPIGDIGLTDFNTVQWKELKLPIQSGDKYRNSDIVLRKNLKLDAPKTALLQLQHLSAGAELWWNKRIIYIHPKTGDAQIDLSNYLIPNQSNELIIRFKAGKGAHLQNAWLDVSNGVALTNLQKVVEEVEGAWRIQVNGTLKAENSQIGKDGFWNGAVSVQVYPFNYSDQNRVIAEERIPLTTRLYKALDFSSVVNIATPKKWSPENPSLYKVVVTLLDDSNQPVTSEAFVTGFRTLSQKDGMLHLNDTPITLRGVNFDNFLPFTVNVSEPLYDPTDRVLLQLIGILKSVNGNALRVPNLAFIDMNRLAFLCDQMGILLVVQPMELKDEATAWSIDWKAAKEQILQLRNSPSVAVWQGNDQLSFLDFRSDATAWMQEFYNLVMQYAPNQLISFFGVQPIFQKQQFPVVSGSKFYDPVSKQFFLNNKKMLWRSERVLHGNADYALSGGKDWDDFQLAPYTLDWDTLKTDYLNDTLQAYLDYKAEWFAGLENPLAVRGTPYRYSDVFESPYTEQAIGEKFIYDEWLLSQAWQSFAIQEALRKKRQLNYDGLFYNALWNGGDPTAVLDATAHAKLAYYTLQAQYQPTVAGSATDDIAYTSKESVPIFLNHAGKAARFKVSVNVKNSTGKTISSNTFPVKRLPSGNNSIAVGDWQPTITAEGWYFVEYIVERL